MKGIKREYSNAKTLQQNRVAERKNRTLIEAARTMLANSLLPITFWAEAVNTACYVLNRALVTKPHNKTPYELLNDRSPRLDFIIPFGCPVTILNTFDPLRKFEGKAEKGFLVGYSVTSPEDTNGNAGTQDNVDAGKEVSDQHHIVLPLWYSISSTYKSLDDMAGDDKPKDDIGSKTVVELINKEDQAYRDELDRIMSQEKEASDAADSLSKEFEQGCMDQRGDAKAGSTNSFNNVSNPVNAANTSGSFNADGPSSSHPNAFIPDDTLLHMEPKKVAQALDDESWVEAMQDELLQFSLQKVTPKLLHLHAVKRIFRYLKGQPKLGLWYPRDSPFDLEAYSDSDYAGANLDRKSTTGDCQFLGRRLISWQCKK
nr:ribonuclease H-like domain-containing protein [Tanacetum cinerariifolium]